MDSFHVRVEHYLVNTIMKRNPYYGAGKIKFTPESSPISARKLMELRIISIKVTLY